MSNLIASVLTPIIRASIIFEVWQKWMFYDLERFKSGNENSTKKASLKHFRDTITYIYDNFGTSLQLISEATACRPPAIRAC